MPGTKVTKILNEQGLATPEGTIYPLLARLKKEGLVTADWRESAQGNPRKYYRITGAGESALEDFQRSWSGFMVSVDNIIREGLVDGA